MTILELKALDRLVKPYNELDIAQYVEESGVEILKWRFLDMWLSVFSGEVKGRICELHFVLQWEESCNKPMTNK